MTRGRPSTATTGAAPTALTFEFPCFHCWSLQQACQKQDTAKGTSCMACKEKNRRCNPNKQMPRFQSETARRLYEEAFAKANPPEATSYTPVDIDRVYTEARKVDGGSRKKRKRDELDEQDPEAVRSKIKELKAELKRVPLLQADLARLKVILASLEGDDEESE